MLCLDIDWLMGVAWLARDPSSPRPDWPPQPDRIFSALVASWGAGGEDAAERAALEWLEACEPPLLIDQSGGAAYRPAPDVFVPVNDQFDAKFAHPWRSRQARRFPAVTLGMDKGAHLRLLWAEAPSPPQLAALNDLAFRTSYIGHSSSLVRCRFEMAGDADEMHLTKTQTAQRAPYPGRLAELEALFRRHMGDRDERARPRPSTRSGRAITAPESLANFTAEAAEWVVFEHAGGERPDLRAAAIVCDTLRKTLMEAWTKTHKAPAPGWIAGHEPDGSPALNGHMAVVPLAHVGFPHGDGRLMGLAIVPPEAVTAAWKEPGPGAFRAQQAFRAAIATLGDLDRTEGPEPQDPVLTLAPRDSGNDVFKPWNWRLRRAASGLKSLDPARYLRRSCRWSSVTPVVLDRHLKASGPEAQEEAVAIVSRACERIGLPAPVEIVLAKYSSVTGAPAAWPPGGAPAWLNWSRKKSFGDRRLFHVRLLFEDQVSGPVLIGAGRFVGLGLCLPHNDCETRP